MYTSDVEMYRISDNLQLGGGDFPFGSLHKVAYDTPPPPLKDGTMEFIKMGKYCQLIWNGEHVGSWTETTLDKEELRISFRPFPRGKARATFKDIKVERLDIDKE